MTVILTTSLTVRRRDLATHAEAHAPLQDLWIRHGLKQSIRTHGGVGRSEKRPQRAPGPSSVNVAGCGDQYERDVVVVVAEPVAVGAVSVVEALLARW